MYTLPPPHDPHARRLRAPLAALALAALLATPAAAGGQSLPRIRPSGDTVRLTGPHRVVPGRYVIQPARDRDLCVAPWSGNLAAEVAHLRQVLCDDPPYAFALVPHAAGWYTLRVRYLTDEWKCVTLARGVLLGVRRLDLQPCERSPRGDPAAVGASDQWFDLRVVRGDAGAPVYEVRTVESECWDVRDASADWNVEIIQFPCRGGAHQGFLLRPDGPLGDAEATRAAEALGWFSQPNHVWSAMRSVLVTEGVNYYGGDYASRPGGTATDCVRACVADGRCRAMTWVRPGTQGPRAVCWLKRRLTPPVADKHTAAAVVRRP